MLPAGTQHGNNIILLTDMCDNRVYRIFSVQNIMFVRIKCMEMPANVNTSSMEQWRIQGGFLVARKPPPPTMIFFKSGGDTVTGTDPYHPPTFATQPPTFATFGNPP